MKSPFTAKEMSIVKEWRTMSFRRDEFRVLFHSYKCEDTGEQLEDETFAQLNFNQLVNQYRVKYAIPFPEQIVAIRKKYGLSAAKMSEIMGFGANVYRQYETGEVPSQSNAKLIQLAEDPHEFKKLVDLCSSLESKVIDKVTQTISSLLEEQKKQKHAKLLEDYFFGACLPTSLTGYRITSFVKFTEMVVYFTEKLQPWKTKLNKLLFYADFEMFRQTGYSISGVHYRAIPMGPVPNNFHSIFEYLCNNDEVDIYYTDFTTGTGEQFKPNKNRQFNAGLFSLNEIAILEKITDRFRHTTTDEIIEISHREKAWIENETDKKLINYNYSFELN